MTNIPNVSENAAIHSQSLESGLLLLAGKRVPWLCHEENIVNKLSALTPWDCPFEGGVIWTESRLAWAYENANGELDYWFAKGGMPVRDPLYAWVQYEVIDEFQEWNHTLWHKLRSPWFKDYKAADRLLWADFPDEQKATMGDFPVDVYVREDHLHVLGRSRNEWNTIYRSTSLCQGRGRLLPSTDAAMSSWLSLLGFSVQSSSRKNPLSFHRGGDRLYRWYRHA